jgi:hypothetical protein
MKGLLIHIHGLSPDGGELLESKFADTATRLMMSVPLSLRRSGLRWP